MQVTELVPLFEIEVNRQEVLAIQRNELVPIFNNAALLSGYAEQLVQAQSVLLQGVDPLMTQQFRQSIEELIQALTQSNKYLKKRRFNALQKWLGIDIEHGSGQIDYYKNLDVLLDRCQHLSQKLRLEIQKSQSRFQQLLGLRLRMANYVVAAQEFVHEYPKMLRTQHPLDQFSERLLKKIHSLQTVQASNDIAMQQIQLSQQLSLGLLDRFTEAQQVLIPAWQYHVKQSQQTDSTSELLKLDNSREKLIKTLRKSLEKPSGNSS
ncbi:tellurium resistance protein [Acinetobacter sp. ANC 4910]|uniref:tellurium resistance protein n=1 Tax=Acinetobacter sp. ANC 4910 TaxID=2529850 RepID=UPI00103A66ED|nr:tellurium resistance protein [Acinetobacter sp. ANC 4910]TCB36262.1 tellurium resistance protein [Acinetobacter sp. ANC 4910]